MTTLKKLWLLGLLASAFAWGVDFTSYAPQGYVSDFAHVVDAPTKAQLEQYCASVESSTGAQLALVTLPTLEGQPLEDVANALYRKWGIGKKGQDNGALLLLVVQDRRNRLEVGYGLEPILPDGFDGSLLRAMRPALRQGNYGDALQEAASRLGERIAQSKGVTIQPATRVHPVQNNQGDSSGLPWGLILFALFVLFLMMRRRGGGGQGGFFPIFLPGSFGGGGFSSSGGGFGGYDSGSSGGGGFGGFGGGDSGGGGASSDW